MTVSSKRISFVCGGQLLASVHAIVRRAPTCTVLESYEVWKGGQIRASIPEPLEEAPASEEM
ncbi:hypothetical protein MAP00_006438 [Monascus purpureus]|nr:hypothetical protein MAP00_006438 [Monascus purpureus]